MKKWLFFLSWHVVDFFYFQVRLLELTVKDGDWVSTWKLTDLLYNAVGWFEARYKP